MNFRYFQRVRANRLKWADEAVLKRIRKGQSAAVPTKLCATWRQGWRVIGGQRNYYRSKWEANYARILEFQRKHGIVLSWRHEPKTFWFEEIRRGVRSYLPDFEVVYPDGRLEYHEVKGWYDSKSKTKTKRMAKYYPDVKLRMVFQREYRTLARQMSGLIPDWE